MRRRAQRLGERFDLVLLGAAVATAVLGVLMVWSATQGAGVFFLVRQLIWVVLGAAAMAGVALADLDLVRRFTPTAYALAVAALVAVLSPLGAAANGAQAWFDLGPLRIQPAELAKPVMILALAAHGHRARGRLRDGRLVGAVTLAAPLVGLVLLQPDLGTAAVLAVVAAGVIIMADAPARQLAALTLCALALVFGTVKAGVLEPYQVDRLTGFLHQSEDPRGATWNLTQAKIAIGSGGVTGAGLFDGSQTSLAYVPEQHTDFIFTVVGEELGFAGAATLLALLGLVVWRTWRAASIAGSRFEALCCAGVLSMLVFQVFQNMGMTMGIMPITGIPLPFVSYGGSSTVACFAAVGLVANVSQRRPGLAGGGATRVWG